MSLRERGFSLLEVLVALTIMALSLGGLYNILGGSVRSSVRVESVTRAALLAESVMSLRRDVPAGGWQAEGQSVTGMRWRVESSPFSGTAGTWPLHRVVVQILDADDAAVLFELVKLLPEREPERS